MCISKKRIYNRWTRSWQYVDCGKCPSCQQAKAARRTKRLKNSSQLGYIALFVTLTYKNDCIPYIKLNELKDNVQTINVYRDFDYRRIRCDAAYNMAPAPVLQTSPISVVDCLEDKLFVTSDMRRHLSTLKGKKGCVGVVYYKDVQNFEKRLRQHLLRHYKVTKPIYTFKCAEYGPSTYRPHFHLLVFCPSESLDKCKRAIFEAWPYDYKDAFRDLRKVVDIARNASSYVAAYVNRSSSFPELLSSRSFKPRHSFGKSVGYQNANFTLQRICEQIRTGDFRFNTVSVRDGVVQDTSVLYPKYIINRYFGKFKGFNRLSSNSLRNIISCPARLFSKESEYLVKQVLCCVTPDDEIDFDAVKKIYNHINLRYNRFISEFPIVEDGAVVGYGLPDNIYSRCLFADYYIRCWIVYYATLLRSSYESVTDDLSLYQMYDNWMDDCTNYHWLHKYVSGLGVDPNYFPINIRNHTRLFDIYTKTYKRRKVTNYSMSQLDYNV